MSGTGELELNYVIGFGGTIPKCAQYHPDGAHLIFSLGSTIVIHNIEKRQQVFLHGHTDRVTCFAISRDGKYIASGQSTHMGFIASVIVWDFAKAIASASRNAGDMERVYTLELHKVKVQALSFSPSGDFLATLGGQDDNNLVIWDMQTGDAICGSPSASDTTLCAQFFNTSDYVLVTAGRGSVRIWEFDRPNRKIHPVDVLLGKYKRNFLSLTVNDADDGIYVGTDTGDVLKINGMSARIVSASDKRYSQGVTSLAVYTEGNGSASRDVLLFGTGDSLIGRILVTGVTMKQDVFEAVDGGVHGLTIHPKFTHITVGTDAGNRYEAPLSTLKPTLKDTAHPNRINGVAFPRGCSDIFATCSVEEIRVWNVKNHRELLRIKVPTQECKSLLISPDGRSLVSGWSDGKIRSFYPESGALLFVIHDAHQGCALDMTQDSQFILSGGEDGQVRGWRLLPSKQRMEVSLKEHKAGVNMVRIRNDETQAVSAGSDGTCIVWDMKRFVRLTAVFATTMFKCALYHPDHSQLLTCGTDRKITYWDAVDSNAIRIVTPKGCDAEITALDITMTGARFVSGGGDKILRLWDYDEGYEDAQGKGHSGTILSAIFSPDQRSIVSVGDEGAIFIWNMPK